MTKTRRKSARWKEMQDEIDEAVFDFVVAFVDERHYPPSMREIGDGAEISSTSVVHSSLSRLRAAGKVAWQENQPRTLRVVHVAPDPLSVAAPRSRSR